MIEEVYRKDYDVFVDPESLMAYENIGSIDEPKIDELPFAMFDDEEWANAGLLLMIEGQRSQAFGIANMICPL